jgi:hypothetical protein
LVRQGGLRLIFSVRKKALINEINARYLWQQLRRQAEV